MKLKVLMFGWEFPPFNSGGLGTACFGLTRALSKNDVDILFVLPKRVEVDSDFVNFEFAEIKEKNISLKIIDSPLSPYLDSSSYESSQDFLGKSIYGRDLLEEVYRYGVVAREIASEGDFDLIHAHDWLSFPAGVEAKKITGKPLVVHVHSTEFDRTGGHYINKEIFNIERTGMEEADQVIAVSDWTKKQIVERYGIDPKKIKVVHNGVDLGDYPETEGYSTLLRELKDLGNKVVLFVGRVTIQKGPDYFLTAAKEVLKYYPQVYFVVAGSGDMQHNIIKQAAELGISDRVLFAGFLRGSELNQVYQMADLFVMPSVSEPFGITALEAAIHGTPVLVSKQSGVKEALTHVLSCDFWDTDEMANKILAVLNYESLHLSLKDNGRNQVGNINWDAAANKCISIYKRVLDQYFG